MIRFSLKLATLLTIAFGMAACASLPEMSRTQVVRDIKVETQLQPEYLIVAPGDEVRWVNMRTAVIVVQIANLDSSDLRCERGFSKWSGGMVESVEVQPNETVSLCFKEPGTVLYNVRAETAVSGGRVVLSGTVSIDGTAEM
jgi:plastocyanin